MSTNYTLIRATNFTNILNAVAVSAGQTLANLLIDVAGSTYSISSNALQRANVNSQKLLRSPMFESFLNQKVVLNFAAKTSPAFTFPIAVTRLNSTNDTYYLAYVDGNGTVNIQKSVSGALAQLASGNCSPALNTSNITQITLTAEGASPTLLKAVITDLTTNTILATVTFSDSTASLQVAGGYGIDGNLATNAYQLYSYQGDFIPTTNDLFVGFIGDSISIGGTDTLGVFNASPPTITYKATLASLANKNVFIYNAGVSGSATLQWQPDQANSLNALEAFNAVSALTPTKYVSIMLGINDVSGSVTTGTYTTRLTTIVNYWLAQGYKIILNFVLYSSKTGYNNQTLIQGYNTAIANLINGKTILLGDSFAYQYFLDHNSNEQSGGLHPNQIGSTALGNLWANSHWKTLYGAKMSGKTGKRALIV